MVKIKGFTYRFYYHMLEAVKWDSVGATHFRRLPKSVAHLCLSQDPIAQHGNGLILHSCRIVGKIEQWYEPHHQNKIVENFNTAAFVDYRSSFSLLASLERICLRLVARRQLFTRISHPGDFRLSALAEAWSLAKRRNPAKPLGLAAVGVWPGTQHCGVGRGGKEQLRELTRLSLWEKIYSEFFASTKFNCCISLAFAEVTLQLIEKPDIAPKKWTQSYAHFLYTFSSYSAGLWYASVAWRRSRL